MTSGKKFLSVAIVAMFVASGFIVICENVSVADDTDCVAVVNDTTGVVVKTFPNIDCPDEEWALCNAIAAVGDGQHVKLLKSFTGKAVGITTGGAGFKIYVSDDGSMSDISLGRFGDEKPLAIDFDGYTYTVENTDIIGESIGFWLPDMFDAVLFNGAIDTDESNPVKSIITNRGYGLLLDQMVLDGRNLAQAVEYDEEGNPVWKDSYALTNQVNSENSDIVIRDTIILAKEDGMEGGKRAMAMNTEENFSYVNLEGQVVLMGGMNNSAMDTVPMNVVDGELFVESGGVTNGEGVGETQLNLQEGSSVMFGEDVEIEKLNVLDDKTGGSVEFENTTATNAKIVAEEDKMEMSGTFGGGGSTITVKTDIGIDEGLMINGGNFNVEEGKKITGTEEGGLLILEKGTKVNGQKVNETATYEIDEKGNPVKVIVVYFATSDHVQSIKYDGKSYVEVEYTSAGVKIDLSKIDVETEKGYHVVGFMVNGEEHGTMGTVTVTESCTITAIVEKGNPAPSDDGKLALIGAIIVFVILIALLALVFSKKTH